MHDHNCWPCPRTTVKQSGYCKTILMHPKPLAQNSCHCPKMCSAELSPVFAKLYNKCLAESCFPSCCKSTSVVPFFNNAGDRFDTGKYSPISLLPIISKLFESFINDGFLNLLTSLAFSLTCMVFVLSGPLLSSWLFSVSVFTIC